MKRAPHTLNKTIVAGNRISLSGPDATLNVTRIFSGVYEIRYDFTAFRVAEDIEKASSLLLDPTFVPDNTPPSILEGSNADSSILTVGADESTFILDRRNGTIRIERRGTVVHGGSIGNRDTVVPRYPVRVHGAPPRHVTGTFNFPMAPGDRFYGLGDKGGNPNRRNRRFLMHNRDALGYRGSFADPLYKSIPFVIKWNPEINTWLGLAITATDVVQADFGVESQYYYSFTLRNGPYRYVVFTGDSYLEILEKYTRLTGRPAFPPAFTFGFLGSSMDYVEPDNAPDRVQEYLKEIETHRIPCEGLYLSSGYYKQENGHRHTFVWNRRKFPDPAGFIGDLRNRGFHIACNVKPGILVDHPDYETLASEGAFIRNENDSVYTEYYWGDNAAFWDFSSSEAVAKWRERLYDQLIGFGVDGIWNDNNEYEIEDSSVPAYSYRSTFALQMAASSWDELAQRNPEERPWVITRSGGMGIQRYARTWSGDNASTWESLKTNLWIGSSMGLTALPFFGHDIGGFFGERPDGEQFLRWCQSAVFQPRFVIHSWNNDGEPTELWSYQKLFPALRSLVLQHYEFLPYTYSQAYQSHRTGRPIQRLLSLEFPHDLDIKDDEDAYMYGDAILVLPVVDAIEEESNQGAEPGTTRRSTRLPRNAVWYDPESKESIHGGEFFGFTVSPHRSRYLVRTGSAVFRSPGNTRAEEGAFPNLQFEIYPPAETYTESDPEGQSRFSYETVFFEDDGNSRLELNRFRTVSVHLESKEKSTNGSGYTLHIARTDTTDWAPPMEDRTLRLHLPKGFFFSDGSAEVSIPFGPDFSDFSVSITGAYHTRNSTMERKV